jgi:hypothetical protein
MTPPGLVATLRLLLALAFTVVLFAGLRAVPAIYDDWLRESAQASAARWPVLVAVWLVLLCVEVVVVCIWRLLTMVSRDQIFSQNSLRWVDLILLAIAAAWSLLFTALVYSVGPLGVAAGPAVALVLMLVIGAVVGLLMVVMRALLTKATTLRADLEAVI